MANIIIVGCGRVGSRLATSLSDNENNVSVIDENPDAFAGLGRSFNGSTFQGLGYDEDTLRRAGVEDADVVAAVTRLDSSNLMIVEVAQQLYNVPHVIARLYDTGHERAYEQLGVDYVCGTTLVADEMYAKISSGHGSHVESFGDFEILRFSLNLIGNGFKSIRVGTLERVHDIRIIAFSRANDSMSSIPNADSLLYHGDIVLACVRRSLVNEFSSWMQ
jgi:trk system potassium uptake protein TrkA